jgi:hypothetical protein
MFLMGRAAVVPVAVHQSRHRRTSFVPETYENTLHKMRTDGTGWIEIVVEITFVLFPPYSAC